MATDARAFDLVDRLANPAYTALTGSHAGLALGVGRARRYPSDVTRILALPTEASGQDWSDAAALLEGCEEHLIGAAGLRVPVDWHVREAGSVRVMAAVPGTGEPDPRVRALTPADGQQMADLVERTRPGPFGVRSPLLGTFVGIHEDGLLLAMGGQRLRGPG